MEVSFSSSKNPDREHCNFEMPRQMADDLFECVASAHGKGHSLSRSDVIRAALVIALPVIKERPDLVKILNRYYSKGNVKN